MRVKYLTFIIKYKTVLLIIAIVCILLALILLFIVCRYARSIKMSQPIIKLAVGFTFSNIMLIFLSLFVLALSIGVFFLAMYLILRIYTTGQEVVNQEWRAPWIKYHNTPLTKFLIYFFFFGLY